MKVEIKKLHPDAIIPKRQTEGSAGFDLHAKEDIEWEPVYGRSWNEIGQPISVTIGYKANIGTGLATAIPVGYEMQIRPRSGFAFKHNITVRNTPGTIDADYRGEIIVMLMQHGSDTPPEIKKGDRIAQGIIAKVPRFYFEETDELSNTERGAGGFGSTGK